MEIPGTNGRCGMAALRLTEGQQLDSAAIAAHLDAELPVYAAPLFIRLLGEVETTGTFKYKKTDLKQAAYNPATVQEPLWVRLPGETRFTPLDHSLFAAIGEQAYRF